MTQVLRQSTQVIVRIGPFCDVTDGFTPETGITLGAADEAEALRAAGAATLDISAATWAAVTGADGWYNLTLDTTATNTVGTLDIVVNDDSVCLPVFARFQVIEEAVFDAMYAASAAGPLQSATAGRTLFVDAAGLADANTVKVGPTGSGTAQTAGDLKASLNTIDDFIDTEIADIQARLPAALVGGKMDSDATAISGDSTAADNLESEYDGTGYGHILQRTTIATLASQTSFTLTAGSADNDAYNGCIIVIQDAATAAQKAVAVIGDYTGATKTVTLLNDPAVFTMATTDIVTIIADRALKATVDNRTLDVSAAGEAGIDWANIGSPTTAQNLSATNIDVDQVVASVSGAVGSVAAGGITSGSFAAGAIYAAAIAADAIGASELAADAVAEIADAIWDEDATGHQTGGTFGQAIGDPVADTNTIFKAVVTDATGATVGVDAAAILADTGTDGVVVNTFTTAGKAEIEAEVDDALGGGTGTALTAIPWNAAWDAEVQSEVDDALIAQRLDELLNADSDIDGAAPPTVGSVVHEMLSKTAGSFTFDQTTDSLEAIRDKETDIETDTAEIGTAGAGLTNINLPDQTMNITGDITGSLSGSVGSVTGAVGSVASGGITAASIAADAIGASELAADAANEIADALLDRTDGVETGLTLRGAMRLQAAVLAGKVSGAGTASEIFRNAVADSKARITATTDPNGNRTTIVADTT